MDEVARRREARPATARAAAAQLTGRSRVLALQRTVGNRAVARLVGCTYDPAEKRAATERGVLDRDVSLLGGLDSPYPASGDSVVVGDFAPDSATLKPSTRTELASSWTPILETQASQQYEILGFTDCVGDPANNARLRDARAQAVGAALPATARRASVVGPAPAAEFLLPANASRTERAWNRSVLVGLAPPPAPPPPPPAPAPTPRPDPSVITPKAPAATRGCSPAQVAQLAIAFSGARRLAEIALKVLSGDLDGVQRKALDLYFGPDWRSHLGDIRAGYRKILDGWKEWDEHSQCHLQTEEDCPADNPNEVTLAYVMGRGGFSTSHYGDVHVCAAAFTRSNEKLAATILHELSHRLDNTGDKRYCRTQEPAHPDPDHDCADLPTTTAIDNADSYAQLALQLFNFLP